MKFDALFDLWKLNNFSSLFHIGNQIILNEYITWTHWDNSVKQIILYDL